MLESYIPNQYLRAIIIFLVLLLILRTVISIIQRILLKLTSKTKTDLDDLVVKKMFKPVTVILFVISVRIAINELTFSLNVLEMVHKTMYSILVITVGYMAYFFLEFIIFRTWKRFLNKAQIQIDQSLLSLIHGALKITLIILAVIYIFDLWGIQIGPFLAGLGIAGLAVALALQPTLSNVFSGIALILDKTVRVGDLVYLDAETKGIIEKIGLRSTKIKTFDNELIIVPNNKLADSKIQNVALPEPKSRVVIQFSTAYGSNIDKVKSIVLKEIKSIKIACKDPQPRVRFIEMANSSLNFKAYFYVESYDHKFDAIDEANTKIYNALNKNKIEIPFPQVDVHLKKK